MRLQLNMSVAAQPAANILNTMAQFTRDVVEFIKDLTIHVVIPRSVVDAYINLKEVVDTIEKEAEKGEVKPKFEVEVKDDSPN